LKQLNKRVAEAEIGARHRGLKLGSLIDGVTGKLELTGKVCQIRDAMLTEAAALRYE
jgi:hypothetical protein